METSITELFEQARTLPEDERRAFLDAACRDAAAREELDRLLRHASDAPGLFERLEAGLAGPVGPDQLIGERVGNYRLDRCLGEGGMGFVFLAHRVDGEFEQQVALKLVKRELAGDVRRALFLRERQILARLDHPYIARLFDGGVTASGTPYFAMEYVEGKPLTIFAEEQRLSTHVKLRLFLKICEAVGHAHRHMVVHQDLKPGNLLVTAAGTPKLLDFGIAGQMIEDGVEGQARARPRAAHGTVGYASPEQCRGETVTSASDVFSLGVVLGELLWGRRQLQHDSVTPRPSTDLEWICARAKEEDPAQRYASVDALAADIERHLTLRPIVARPSSLGYRFARFFRRHRVGVAAAGIVAAVLVLYTASAVARARETAQQRDRAELERNASHRVSEFLTQFVEVQRVRGSDTAATSMLAALDRGVERQERELLPASELHGVVLRNIAEIYARLGYPDRGVSVLHRSLDVLIAAKGSNHPSVAGSWHALGRMLLQEGCVAAAESAMRRALAIQESQLKEDDPMMRRTREDLEGFRGFGPAGSLPPRPDGAPRLRPPRAADGHEAAGDVGGGRPLRRPPMRFGPRPDGNGPRRSPSCDDVPPQPGR